MQQYDGALGVSHTSGFAGITAGFSPFSSRPIDVYPGGPGSWEGFFSSSDRNIKREDSFSDCREKPEGNLQHRWQEQIAGLEKLVKDSCARGEQTLALEYAEQIDLVMKKLIAFNTAGTLAVVVALSRRKFVVENHGVHVIGMAKLGKFIGFAAADESYSVTLAKREEGVATDLEVARTTVEVEGIRRSLAEQQLSIALARRALTTLTGIVPSPDVPDVADDLHGEAALGAWEERISQLPTIRGAAASTASAHEQASAARLALLPTVAATATEQVTNAAGLVGHEVYFTGMVTASWRLDVAALARRKGQGAAEQAARVQEEATANCARDAVHEAWQRVDSGIMASQSARSQAAAARLAADKARERYAAGAGTQLELIQAQRDLSSMEAARIQTDANLALDRILLRLAVGER